MKPCTLCGDIKPLEAFHRSRTAKDGRQSRCKDCQREHVKQWRAAHPGYSTEFSRKWRAQNARRVREHRLANQARHPEKVRARKTLYDAVKRGRVTKPDACEQCGAATERHELDGHHEDYSQPLDVIWLCGPCHARRHWSESEAA